MTTMATRGAIPPRAFGDYVILKKVASGGMGEVFQAELRSIGGFRRQVAIKTILPELTGEGDFVTMLLDEARLVARLQHPSIVQVLNCGCFKGTYFIVMDFVEGVSS